MRILGICGSLRAQSSNLAALEAAALLAPPPLEIVLYRGLAELPHFNPDLDGERPPEPVMSLRQAVAGAQALLICSPEYASGVAGVLKNALDWLVSCVEFPGKPVAVINASPRATHADAALRLTLETMAAHLIPEASITLPLLGRNLDARGIIADAALCGQLSSALQSLSRALPPAA
jgi:NAD(P)H-dependent FMN reductase